ncbi:MAG: hypothetical protein H7A52_14695 [Akkermansiaceae bacterium]|nr:hypothetical protein [Akkermansiaceae bacterium]
MKKRLLFLLSLTLLGPLFGGWAQPPSPRGDHADPLRPVPEFGRLITAHDVRQHWLRNLPAITPPSRLDAGYAHEMPHYREELERRNCLVDAIARGDHDTRAECEALLHNIRHCEKHGDSARAGELRLKLMRTRALEDADPTDAAALLYLQSPASTSTDIDGLKSLILIQSRRLAELERQLETLCGRLDRLERAARAPSTSANRR